MTAVLGISAFYHDAAAALVIDGEVVAAAQEERFSRKKHDAGFPARAVRYVLREAGLKPEDLDAVGFYDKPLLKFERMLSTYVATFHAIGSMWTAVILSVVYFLSVAGVSLFMKLFGKDPLDRTLAPEASFWRAHQPNPLGPRAAARHQF